MMLGQIGVLNEEEKHRRVLSEEKKQAHGAWRWGLLREEEDAS